MPADCGGQRHEGLGRIFFILYSAVLRPIPDSDEEARERIFLIEKNDYHIGKARSYGRRPSIWICR